MITSSRETFHSSCFGLGGKVTWSLPRWHSRPIDHPHSRGSLATGNAWKGEKAPLPITLNRRRYCEAAFYLLDATDVLQPPRAASISYVSTSLQLHRRSPLQFPPRSPLSATTIRRVGATRRRRACRGPRGERHMRRTSPGDSWARIVWLALCARNGDQSTYAHTCERTYRGTYVPRTWVRNYATGMCVASLDERRSSSSEKIRGSGAWRIDRHAEGKPCSRDVKSVSTEWTIIPRDKFSSILRLVVRQRSRGLLIGRFLLEIIIAESWSDEQLTVRAVYDLCLCLRRCETKWSGICSVRNFMRLVYMRECELHSRGSFSSSFFFFQVNLCFCRVGGLKIAFQSLPLLFSV